MQEKTDIPHPTPFEELRVEDVRFFVGGHGRSGTTWLERTLNSHPEVLCKGSGMFFGREIGTLGGRRLLYEVLAGSEELKAWHGSGPLNLWTQDGNFERDAAQITRAAIDSIMRRELTKADKRVLGDRTPHHISYLQEMYALYPEAKMVHAIRDGRDVAISGIHNFWGHSKDKGGHIELSQEEVELRDAYLENREDFLASGRSIFTEERIRQRAKGWNRIVSRGRATGKELFGDNYFDFHYEDHLDRPLEALGELFDFLGVDTSPEVIEQAVEANSFEKRTGRTRGQEASGTFHRKGVAGDWKGVFTERDKEIFKEEAGDLLVELGYEEDGNW